MKPHLSNGQLTEIIKIVLGSNGSSIGYVTVRLTHKDGNYEPMAELLQSPGDAEPVAVLALGPIATMDVKGMLVRMTGVEIDALARAEAENTGHVYLVVTCDRDGGFRYQHILSGPSIG